MIEIVEKVNLYIVWNQIRLRIRKRLSRSAMMKVLILMFIVFATNCFAVTLKEDAITRLSANNSESVKTGLINGGVICNPGLYGDNGVTQSTGSYVSYSCVEEASIAVDYGSVSTETGAGSTTTHTATSAAAAY